VHVFDFHESQRVWDDDIKTVFTEAGGEELD
jgi:hypothetical protein